MLWKLILWLAALLTPHSHKELNQEEEFVPTPHGPQTLEEYAKAREALHGEHFGGDMKLPEDWNGTEAYVRDPRFRWPGGVVPFVIDRSVSHYYNQIIAGMQQYHRNTCIRFVQRTNQRDFVRIFYGNGCWSAIGRNGGMQELSLGDGCGYVGLAVHELGHAIGLIHEHQRPDRDNFITVYKQNVVPDQLGNFNKVYPENVVLPTQYDYNSIMHYGNYAFSRVPNRLPTMVAKNGQRLYEPFEKPGFDQNDIYNINLFYGCR